MSDCIFCRIVAGEIPADVVYSDEKILAFRDINPVAPVHILVIPKKHISSLAELKSDDGELMGQLMQRITQLAKENCPNNEYRIVANTGASSGQTVAHLHYHLLGGRQFGWPPG